MSRTVPLSARNSDVLPKSASETSLVSSRQATALEVCDLVYGESELPESDIVERIYEANAGTYGNPLVTANTREQIADLYALCRSCSTLDVPRPLAFVSALFGRHPGTPSVLLRGVRAWSEVSEVSESETFDGHRRCIVEHAIHVLLLPGLHTASGPRHRPSSGSEPTLHAGTPALSIPGTTLAVPSPFHVVLPVTTKLSFNDAGRITYHRDVWDIADVLALVPGAPLAQWVGSRVTATALSLVRRAGGVLFTAVTPTTPQDVEVGKQGKLRGALRWTPVSYET